LPYQRIRRECPEDAEEEEKEVDTGNGRRTPGEARARTGVTEKDTKTPVAGGGGDEEAGGTQLADEEKAGAQGLGDQFVPLFGRNGRPQGIRGGARH
jgi:hypothetical protein